MAWNVALFSRQGRASDLNAEFAKALPRLNTEADFGERPSASSISSNGLLWQGESPSPLARRASPSNCRVIGISGGGRAAFIGISRRVILRLRRNSGYPGLSEAPKSRRDNPIPRYPDTPNFPARSANLCGLCAPCGYTLFETALVVGG